MMYVKVEKELANINFYLIIKFCHLIEKEFFFFLLILNAAFNFAVASINWNQAKRLLTLPGSLSLLFKNKFVIKIKYWKLAISKLQNWSLTHDWRMIYIFK